MGAHFEALYARRGRPSIAPERLLRALLLQALYAIRSETQLMEQLDYNLLYRWFVGLSASAEVWDVTVFTKNRERLMEGEVSQRLLEAVLRQAEEKKLLSAEHFTVDGTLIQAWASRKSFVPKEKPPEKGSGAGGEEVVARHARIEERSGGAIIQEKRRWGIAAELLGARDDREP